MRARRRAPCRIPRETRAQSRSGFVATRARDLFRSRGAGLRVPRTSATQFAGSWFRGKRTHGRPGRQDLSSTASTMSRRFPRLLALGFQYAILLSRLPDHRRPRRPRRKRPGRGHHRSRQPRASSRPRSARRCRPGTAASSAPAFSPRRSIRRSISVPPVLAAKLGRAAGGRRHDDLRRRWSRSACRGFSTGSASSSSRSSPALPSSSSACSSASSASPRPST